MTYYKSRLTKAKVSSASPVVSAADDGGDGRARAGAYAPFLLVATATFFAFLSIGIVLPVLPRYTEGPLGAGDIGVGIAIGAASLTALLAQPPAGRLGDFRGRRPLMIGGGVLMVLGAAGLVVAEHIVPVVGLCLLTGIGRLHRLHHALRARRRSRRRGAAVRDLRRRRRDDPEPRREDSRPRRACEDGPVRAGRPRGRAGDDRNLEPLGLYVGTVVFSVGQALAFPAVLTLAMARAPPPAERLRAEEDRGAHGDDQVDCPAARELRFAALAFPHVDRDLGHAETRLPEPDQAFDLRGAARVRLREKLGCAAVDRVQAARGICDPAVDAQTHQPPEERRAERPLAARLVSVRLVAVAGDEPGPDGGVELVRLDPLDEPAQLRGGMLPVGVEAADDVVLVLDAVAVPARDRRTQAAVVAEGENLGATLPRDVGGSVGGAVVDDEHVDVGQLAAQLSEDAGEVVLLVPGRDEDQRSHCDRHARIEPASQLGMRRRAVPSASEIASAASSCTPGP